MRMSRGFDSYGKRMNVENSSSSKLNYLKIENVVFD
jgi:hypothetical protein